MLSKPYFGWSDFKLEGTSTYSLSYLDDIAFEWLDEAIYGLKKMHPFCVKGCMEPDSFLCVVSYDSCYVMIEDEFRYDIGRDYVEYVPISMLEFCKYLYKDINEYFLEWVSFTIGCVSEDKEKEAILKRKLEELHCLIVETEKRYNRYAKK